MCVICERTDCVKMRVRKPRAVLPFLQTLMGMTPAQRTIILGHIDDKSYEMLYDTVMYVLTTGRRKLSDDDGEKVRRLLGEHKCDLRYLCNHKKAKTLKKKRLMRMGGFPLGVIVSTAIPLLTSLVSSLIKK